MSQSIDLLVRRVQQHVREHRCPMDEAFRAVASSVAEHPAEMAAWWALLGSWWVQAAYQAAHGEQPSASSPSPQRENRVAHAVASEERRVVSTVIHRGETAPRPSWRTKVDPMDLTMPVGNTGVRKRLGDFTREDAREVQNVYQQRATEAAGLARAWGRIVGKLEGGKTLGSLVGEVDLVELGIQGGRLRLPAPIDG